jgi:very-short-patch-repair endonuclease
MVTCLICKQAFQQITPSHLKHAHGITMASYKARFPGVKVDDSPARKAHWTAEERAKKGAQTRAWSATPEGQAKLKARKHWSEGPNAEATKAKIGAQARTPEARSRAGAASKVRDRAKLGATMREVWNRPGMREKIVAAQTEASNRPEVKRARHEGQKRTARANYYTSEAERWLGDLLDIPKAHRQFWVEGAGEIDLADPVHKVGIEVQGCYYHGCLVCGFTKPGNKGQRERDAAKASKLLELGWVLVTVWTHEIKPHMPRRKIRVN